MFIYHVRLELLWRGYKQWALLLNTLILFLIYFSMMRVIGWIGIALSYMIKWVTSQDSALHKTSSFFAVDHFLVCLLLKVKLVIAQPSHQTCKLYHLVQFCYLHFSATQCSVNNIRWNIKETDISLSQGSESKQYLKPNPFLGCVSLSRKSTLPILHRI